MYVSEDSADGFGLLGDGVCGGRNTYTTKNNFEACKEWCNEESTCTGITWDPTAKSCGLHKEAAPSAPLSSGEWTKPYKCYLKGIINTDNNDS